VTLDIGSLVLRFGAASGRPYVSPEPANDQFSFGVSPISLRRWSAPSRRSIVHTM
jgi:hypothetical protein